MADEPEYLTPLQRQYLSRNPEAVVADDQQKSHRPETGVYGWLGFLALCLVALGPISTLASTASEIGLAESGDPALAASKQWQDIVALLWAVSGLYCVISILAGWRLFKRHVPNTIPIVIACIWIAGPGLAILTLLTIDLMIDSPATVFDGAGLARPLIYSVVWTAYLLRSKRVRNTYWADTSPPADKSEVA